MFEKFIKFFMKVPQKLSETTETFTSRWCHTFLKNTICDVSKQMMKMMDDNPGALGLGVLIKYNNIPFGVILSDDSLPNHYEYPQVEVMNDKNFSNSSKRYKNIEDNLSKEFNGAWDYIRALWKRDRIIKQTQDVIDTYTITHNIEKVK